MADGRTRERKRRDVCDLSRAESNRNEERFGGRCGVQLTSLRLSFCCLNVSNNQLEQISTTWDTYVLLAALLAALAHDVLAVLHLEVISAHIHETNAATPRRCAHTLGGLTPGFGFMCFTAARNISTHPLRDLRHRERSMKPSRRATSALRHKCLSLAKERGGGFHLRAMLFCCCCCCGCGCVYLNVSTSGSRHLRDLTPGIDDGAAASSTGGMSMESKESKESGQGDGYVRGRVFVVEEEKIRSAHRETNNTPTPSLCCFQRNHSH